MARLTCLTALDLGGNAEVEYSVQELDFAISALPQLCCLRLALKTDWGRLNTVCLLRMAAQHSVEEWTQRRALQAVLARPEAEVALVAKACWEAMSGLLEFLGVKHWKSRFGIQVRTARTAEFSRYLGLSNLTEGTS